MLREPSPREEFSYAQMTTLERGASVLSQRGDWGLDGGSEGGSERGQGNLPERDSYTVDVRASHLQLAPASPRLHPCLHSCLSCRAWLYSVVLGGSLLIAAGFSLYLGNVFPVAMDYLRCAAGSSLPAAVACVVIALNRHAAVSDFLVMHVSTFAVITTCLVWFGCKLVINPSAVNINFNLLLMIVLEVLMSTTVILSARSADDCCRKELVYDRPVVLAPAVFPSRVLKVYSVVELMVGIAAVFGGIIALNIDVLLPGPYLSVTFFWVLVACFPSAIASHVVAEYPSRSLVEMLIAISSVTSPLLFSAAAFLSCSVLNVLEIFLKEVPADKRYYDILLVILMVLLLVQAVLTLATVLRCAAYKTQLRMGAPEWDDSLHTPLGEQQASNGTLQDFDKDKAWKAVVVQMAQ